MVLLLNMPMEVRNGGLEVNPIEKNGPAVEYANGDKFWYLNGVYYKESDYWKELNK